MAQLIQMRQRIKAIETTKKITHAMRLISMSSHTRLRAKRDYLGVYKATVAQLLARITTAKNINETVEHGHGGKNKVITPKNVLIILVGSQKGLCGTFNTMLFKALTYKIAQSHFASVQFITVGKKAKSFIESQYPQQLHAAYDFTMAQLTELSQHLASDAITLTNNYDAILLMSNGIKSFFIQSPQCVQILPVIPEKHHDTNSAEEYMWEQSSDEIYARLFNLKLEAEIHYALFESLLAEQAARFISMDNATRNAKELLEETKLQYNKLRQAKITRELTELVGGL